VQLIAKSPDHAITDRRVLVTGCANSPSQRSHPPVIIDAPPSQPIRLLLQRRLLHNTVRPKTELLQLAAGAPPEGAMKSRVVAAMFVFAVLVCVAATASAESSKDILGTWMLHSLVVDHGGVKIEPYGANPRGAITFGPDGRFSLIVSRSDLPPLASNNRLLGTVEEYRAIVQGSIAYFGTYTIDESARTFTVHVEGGTFPNWVGTDQKRIFSVSGDELKYTNTNRSAGAGTALVVWRRVK
jgi:hypothetical protein